MTYWEWPQWTIAIILFIEILTHCILHGTEKTIKYSVIDAIFISTINALILYYGGFWK